MSRYYSIRKYILLIGLSTIVFGILYHNVIFGNTTNMFMDVGADTIFMAYPNQYLRDHLFRGGYALNYGLGIYIPGRWLDMLQPFNLVRVFVSDIVVANIISLYLESLVTTIFSYLLFKKLYEEDLPAFVCALIWTYSGYMILWGQHAYTVNIVYLTIIIFFLQSMLNEEKKGYFMAVPFTILAIHSYYFFYMDGLFAAFYIVVYSVINKSNIKNCIRNLLKLLLSGVFAVGMGAVGLLPGLSKFLTSARTSVQEQKISGLFHDVKYMFSVVGRCLSNDIFGTANNFTGYYNYYEAAVLTCSALFIPCLVILMKNKKYGKHVIALLCICLIALATPVSSYILNLDSRKPRWTFMIIFAMIVGIGYCIREVMKGNIAVGIRDAIDILLVYTIFFTVLMVGDRHGIADVKRVPFILSISFAVCYLIVLYCLMNRKRSISCGIIMLILVAVEMVINNYPAINYRNHITKDMLANGLYNDGTKQVLAYIQDDEMVYRVNKTYDSVFLNDSMVQGYNGLRVYDATNSQHLIDYYQAVGHELINGKIHYVTISTNNNILNTLLGVKYIVAKSGNDVPEGYALLHSYGDKVLYFNERSIGFGYIYSLEMSKEQYDILNIEDRLNALCKYYYITNEPSATVVADVNLENVNIDKALDKLRDNSAYDTSIKNNVIEFKIDNQYSESSMLCIPVIYDSNWKIYINGEEKKSININGGLLGVDMSGCIIGTNKVKIVYGINLYRYGGIISVISVIAYIIVWLYLRNKKWKS